MVVHQGIAWLVSTNCTAEGDFAFIGWWGGTPARPYSVCWIYFYWHMFGCSWEICLGLLQLRFDAMDQFVHGNVLGSDNEESALCGGSEF